VNLELNERLEAAAVDGWPATVTRAAPGGWLLRATPGLDRGRSNNALTPCRELGDAEIAPAIELVCAFSDEHSIRPGIQVSPVELHDRLQEALDRRRWSRQWETVVMTGPARATPATNARVSADDHASREWLRVWARCEPGRDLDAHATTVFSLLRGRACSARIGSEAVGIGVIHDRLVGMFCIAVDSAHRREGLGTAIVTALLERLGDGAELGYLQVEELNAAGRGLYAKARLHRALPLLPPSALRTAAALAPAADHPLRHRDRREVVECLARQ
jgi:N-acetylglutamate synthase